MQHVNIAEPEQNSVFTNANDLIALCYEQDAGCMLLYAHHLPPEFFDLSSRVAGEILQKLSNYRVKAAIIMEKDTKTSTLFPQLAGEMNKSGAIRFFETREEALAWLKE